jgi:hypothetical protein
MYGWSEQQMLDTSQDVLDRLPIIWRTKREIRQTKRNAAAAAAANAQRRG